MHVLDYIMLIYRNKNKNMENRYTKQIKNIPGYYITTTGKVIGKRGKELKQITNRSGYAYIPLYLNGKIVNRFIHRLVYQTFIGEIEKGYTIDHIDENKKNNRLENLQQLKRKENWQKFIDKNVTRDIDGYKLIEEFPNYYINDIGEIISFKYGKYDDYEGKKLYTKGDEVFLLKNNKRYAISIKALLNKYHNKCIKVFNKKYKNID